MKLKVEYISIQELKVYKNNARTHNESQLEAIKESIKRFGFIAPVVIDENKMILVGHGRVMAAKLLKMEKVPCVYVDDLSEEQKKAFIHADNLLTEKGEWDYTILENEINSINMDMTAFGFDEVETEDEDEEKTKQEKLVKCPKCGKEFLRKDGRHNGKAGRN